MDTSRILIVEDDENDFILMKKRLHQSNPQFQIDWIDQFDKLKESLVVEPQVIVCDFKMGGFNALDVINYLQNINSSIPIIIVSGAIGEEYAAMISRRGAADYILKDNMTRLPNAVTREIANYWEKKKLIQSQEQVKILEKQKIHWQKMEGYSQLAGSMVHEYNTIFATIQLALVRIAQSPNKEFDKEVSQIRKSLSLASKLNSNLLIISKGGILGVGKTNLRIEIEKMRQKFPHLSAGYNFSADRQIPMAAEELGKIIDFLVSSSPTSDENTFEISALELTLDKETNISTKGLQPGKYLCISVIFPINENSAKDDFNFFDPHFETGNTEGRLSPLLSYNQIHNTGGGFNFHNDLTKKKFTCSVYLPLVAKEKEGPSQTSETIQRSSTAQRKKTLHFLAVDDSPEFLSVVSNFLDQLGYQVTQASSVKDAWEKINSNPNGIDVIISDMVMPTTSGFTFLKNLREKNNQIPFILMSGFLSEAINSKELSELNAYFMEKPLPEEAFIELLKSFEPKDQLSEKTKTS